MSDNEVWLSISIPLDSDGFLRRECPTCEREFKWLQDDADDAESLGTPDGGYYCPYCAIQAPPGSWFTQAQLDLAENEVINEVIAPELERFSSDIESIGRRPGSLVSFRADYDLPDKLDPLIEADDMKRISFTCHPGEPVKVLDDWDRQVYCLICGIPSN